MIYCTHAMLETTNIAVVLFIATSALHMVSVVARSLYTANLYIELVWLLVPTALVVLLIARVIVMQCSDEELSFMNTLCYILCSVKHMVSFNGCSTH